MINAKALAYASAAAAGGLVLFIGLLNLAHAAYGQALLAVLASVSPGYHGDRTLESILIASGYAMCWGAAAGGGTAWLYNRARKKIS